MLSYIGSATYPSPGWRRNIIVRMYFACPVCKEGFGIVFLEAMAAGKPIVAVRAAAVPEVVRNGILAEPENAESLAAGIVRLYRNPDPCRSLASACRADVENFDVHRVAGLFLSEISKALPAIEAGPPIGAIDRCVGAASIQDSSEVFHGR